MFLYSINLFCSELSYAIIYIDFVIIFFFTSFVCKLIDYGFLLKFIKT